MTKALVRTGERRVFQVVPDGSETSVEQPFEWVDVDPSTKQGDYLISANPTDEEIADAYYNKTESDARYYTQAQVDAGFHPLGALLGENIQSGNYTFQLSDMAKMVKGTNATAQTFTIPDATFPAHAVLNVLQWNTGQITIAAGAGVTLRYDDEVFNPKTMSQYAMLTIYFESASDPVLGGQLELA